MPCGLASLGLSREKSPDFHLPDCPTQVGAGLDDERSRGGRDMNHDAMLGPRGQRYLQKRLGISAETKADGARQCVRAPELHLVGSRR